MKTTFVRTVLALTLACFASTASAQQFGFGVGGVNVRLGGGSGSNNSGGSFRFNASSGNGIRFSAPSSGVRVRVPANVLPSGSQPSKLVIGGGSSTVRLPASVLPGKVVVRPSTTYSYPTEIIEQPADNGTGLTDEQLAQVIAAVNASQPRQTTVSKPASGTGLSPEQLAALIAAIQAAQNGQQETADDDDSARQPSDEEDTAVVPAEFVGTWYEDSPEDEEILFSYVVREDGSYDMFQYRKNLPPMEALAVAKLLDQPFTFDGRSLTLSPGSRQEGPFSTTASGTSNGQRLLILTGGGQSRVWRSEP